MKIAVTLLLSLVVPLPLMGLASIPYSYGYESSDIANVQTLVISGPGPEIVKDDIVLRLRPVYPVDDPSTQSSDYGYRLLSDCKRCSRHHQGVDYPLSDLNKNVYSIMDGVVSQVQHSGGYGVHVIIEHVIYPNKLVYSTIYAHLRQSTVTKSLSVGDIVTKGQLIGYIGSTGVSTGPHLHFEIHENDNVLDPAVFFEKNMLPDPK
jgi:murein DD-endopeptidase MepM/ murein hydrolase activator NlpD